MNADVLIRSSIDVDDFIDCVEGNKKYLPAITCISKADLATVSQVEEIKKQLNADVAISAEMNINIDNLKEFIFEKLDFMRIYMKEPRKDADMNEPMIIKRNSIIKDVCEKTHKDFIKKFRFARVWGKSAKHQGQVFHKPNHILMDKDILEIHLR